MKKIAKVFHWIRNIIRKEKQPVSQQIQIVNSILVNITVHKD